MINSWVVITGASRGLGAYLADVFWNSGWSLVLIARDGEALSKLVKQMGGRPSQLIITLTCDLVNAYEVDQIISELNLFLPRLDVLINNAAIHGPIGPLTENDMALWNKAIQVNLVSPVSLCRGLIPLMVKSGGGSIINLSGGGATGPRANFTAYATAKAGLVRFSESLAEEVFGKNIRVNCIAPGVMQTELLSEVVASGVAAGERELFLAKSAFKAGGDPMKKVGDLALFLAGNKSQNITGRLISAVWDNWQNWPNYLDQLKASDLYTLRRITGRDRDKYWGDL